MTQLRSQRRSAFTLVELMGVIVIISILVALLIPVITGVLRRGAEMRARQDIAQLDGALQSFMSTFGVSYVPSRIRLCTLQSTYTSTPSANPQVDIDSQQYLLKLFPKLSSTGSAWAAGGSGVNWTGHPLYTSGVNPGDETLEGHQCLVFFLGGIQVVSPSTSTTGATYTGTCSGFSTNPANPADTTATVNRMGPFFDFQGGQLTYISHFTNTSNGFLSSLFHDQSVLPPPTSTPTGQLANAIFLSYLDTYKQQPYAYFSAYKSLNKYGQYAATIGTGGPFLNLDNASLLAAAPATITPPIAPSAPTLTGGSLCIQPYATNVNAIAPTAFYKPDRYQILCAGQDGLWGLPPTAVGGGVQSGAPYGFWSPNGSNCTNSGKDDLSNFTTGKMVAGE
jgi:type II secretory pathway pseudopilin PulG